MAETSLALTNTRQLLNAQPCVYITAGASPSSSSGLTAAVEDVNYPALVLKQWQHIPNTIRDGLYGLNSIAVQLSNQYSMDLHAE